MITNTVVKHTHIGANFAILLPVKNDTSYNTVWYMYDSRTYIYTPLLLYMSASRLVPNLLDVSLYT